QYFCLTETHVCMLGDYTGPAAAFAQPAGVQRDDYGTLTREDLGWNFVNGLNASARATLGCSTPARSETTVLSQLSRNSGFRRRWASKCRSNASTRGTAPRFSVSRKST